MNYANGVYHHSRAVCKRRLLSAREAEWETHILRSPLGRSVTFTKLLIPVSIPSLQSSDFHYSPTVVQNALLSTALGGLLLLLLVDLGGLRLDLTGTGKRTVNYANRGILRQNSRSERGVEGAGRAAMYLFPFCLDDEEAVVHSVQETSETVQHEKIRFRQSPRRRTGHQKPLSSTRMHRSSCLSTVRARNSMNS